MTNNKSIKTRKQYQEALKKIESLMDAQAGTPEGTRLAILVSLVEAYEKKHFPIDASDSVLNNGESKMARNVRATHKEQLRDMAKSQEDND